MSEPTTLLQEAAHMAGRGAGLVGEAATSAGTGISDFVTGFIPGVKDAWEKGHA